MNPIRVNKRHIVLASIVLALGIALGINYWFSPEKHLFSNKLNEIPTSTNIGDAIYVNSSKVEDENEKNDEKNTEKVQEFFDHQKSEREKKRDKLIKIASDNNTGNKVINEFRQETNIEDLAKLKLNDKITECIAIIGNDGCNFIVNCKKSNLTDNDVQIIKDIIYNQTGFRSDKIKIIEKN